MNSKLSFIEQLSFITTRIETSDEDGDIFTATGFFYNFIKYNSEGKQVSRIPVIITNRHVVEGSAKLEFKLPITKEENKSKSVDQINVSDLTFATLTMSIEAESKNYFFHPDDKIDLCAIPIGGIINQMKEKANLLPFFKAFDHTDIINSETALENLDAVEEIIMIGYPNGLWDEKNNLPIFRKGITATHPAIDYNGRCEFLIDAACFEGSSGSPVYLFDKIETPHKSDNEKKNYREILLGILWAGEAMDVEGEIRQVTKPTRKTQKAIVEVMLNLGVVIKAEKILDFEQFFNK